MGPVYLTILGVTNSGSSATIKDDLTGPTLTDTTVGMYVVGEPVPSSTAGISRFTTSGSVPTWLIGTAQRARLFQAFLAPAIFVSATALLILSINVRLMGIVGRLRQYVHARHDAAKNNRIQEAEAYTAQIDSIEQRAELIRRCFLLVLISLAATVTSCLLLGVGLYWKEAAEAAVALFVFAMISLLAGTIHYIREVIVALSSVRNEACDSRFMDLGAPPEIRGHNPL